MVDNLALRIARTRVSEYAGDSGDLMRRHAEAMECRDCEEFLNIGLEAYKWVRRAEDTMREADCLGFFEFNRSYQESLDALYGAWQGPCEFAERWITSLCSRSYVPDNVYDFRKACEEVEYIVEHRDWQNRATKTRASNDSKEAW